MKGIVRSATAEFANTPIISNEITELKTDAVIRNNHRTLLQLSGKAKAKINGTAPNSFHSFIAKLIVALL